MNPTASATQPADLPSTKPGRLPFAPNGPVGWFLNPYVQIALGSLTVTASELLMKAGANAVPAHGGIGGWLGIAALSSGWTWLGIVSYILSFVSWIYVLRFVPLAIAYALINVVHILIPLGTWLFLHETISAQRWFGISLVLVGLLLLVGPLARAEAKR
jgi:drug/metabolite transporter (DMT)-like permease